MILTRREAVRQLSALFAIPLVRWPDRLVDPLAGTILEYQAGRARGDWNAEHVVRRSLDRVYARNHTLHAVDLLSDAALTDARASDARGRRGALRGPLDGVPVFAKAIYDMKGLPTTGSNAEWARLFPGSARHDALEVARMRAAGAIVLGKTAADDFAYHGNGTSSLSGQVPQSIRSGRRKTPGGSSAGSAVSVACGIAFAALGTDDGGSNRIPAQFCGVVGMKPTFGLVPRTGVIPTWPYLDTHGPRPQRGRCGAVARCGRRSRSVRWARAHRAVAAGVLAQLHDDALVDARLGLVDIHVPRAQMTSGITVRLRSRRGGSHGRRSDRGIVRAGGDARQCANTLHRGGEGARRCRAERQLAGGDGKRALSVFEPTAMMRGGRQRGLAAYRAFYDVLPKDWAAMSKLIVQPYEHDAAGESFARSRATVISQLAETFRAQRLDAMIYPTMPFLHPRCGSMAGCSHHPRLWQLARDSGSLGTGGNRGQWHAGGEYLVRRTAGERRAIARAGTFLSAAVATVRCATGSMT